MSTGPASAPARHTSTDGRCPPTGTATAPSAATATGPSEPSAGASTSARVAPVDREAADVSGAAGDEVAAASELQRRVPVGGDVERGDRRGGVEIPDLQRPVGGRERGQRPVRRQRQQHGKALAEHDRLVVAGQQRHADRRGDDGAVGDRVVAGGQGPSVAPAVQPLRRHATADVRRRPGAIRHAGAGHRERGERRCRHHRPSTPRRPGRRRRGGGWPVGSASSVGPRRRRTPPTGNGKGTEPSCSSAGRGRRLRSGRCGSRASTTSCSTSPTPNGR